MRRLAAAVVGLALLGGGVAHALEETWSTDKNANGKYIRNLAAPTVATNPARRDDVSPTAAGYMLAPGSHALPLTSTATIPGGDVTLTATRIAFGSGSNLITNSARLTYADSTVSDLIVGDGSTTTNAHVYLNSTGTLGSRFRWQTGGVTYLENSGSRDGTASTGLVTSTVTIIPVAGGSGNDVWSVRNTGAAAGVVQVYTGKLDVALGGTEVLSTSATNGFVFLPRVGGAPTGVPERAGVTSGPRDRYATVIDSTNNRFYFYDNVEAAWHYASFDDGATAGAAITSLTGDVTATGPGAAAATIANDAVGLGKIVNFITDSFPCRDTAGTGDLEVCAVGGGVEFNGGPGIQRSALTGDITASAGSNATTLATVNSNVGSFTYGSFTVNAKGLITAASSGATPALAARTLTAGAGMTGGGDLSADRTFDVVAGDATLVVAANSIVAGVMQTANYADASVLYAKIQDVSAASRVLCRGSAGGAGDMQECTLGTGLAMTGTVLSATATGLSDADYGDITVSGTGTVWTIDNDVVSDAKLRNSGALTLIGRSVNTSGDPADISASAGSGCVYREGSSTIACGTVATAGYADDSVTDAKIREFAGLSVLGRGSNTTGNGADITAGADGDVLRRSGTTLAFGAVPVASVTGAVPDSRTISTTAPLSGGGALSGNLTLTTSMATDRLLGRDTAGTGAAESLTVTGGLEFNGGPGIQTSAFTGDVTKTAGGTALTIAANAVTNAKFRQSAGVSVVGVAGSSSADVADITAASDGQVLRRSGTTLGFGSIPVASVTGAEVTLTAGTGMTRVTNTLNVNLSTGVSGGQTVIGGTASGNSLTYSSTSNATKGSHIFGTTAGLVFNESTGVMSLGGTPSASVQFHQQLSQNGGTYYMLSNANAGTFANVGIIASNSNTIGSGSYAQVGVFGTNATAFGGLDVPGAAFFQHVATSATQNMLFVAHGSQDMIFATTTGHTERMRIANGGNVSIANLNTGIVRASSDVLGVSTLAGGSFRVLAANSGGDDFTGSDEIRIDTGSDYLMISNDGAWSHRNMGSGSMVGASNYDEVIAFWSGNVWNLKSQAGGSGIVRPMSIDAGTAALTLDGSAVTLPLLAGSSHRAVIADPSGNLYAGSPIAASKVDLVYYFEFSSGRVTILNGANQYISTTTEEQLWGSNQIEYPMAGTAPKYGIIEAKIVGTNTITGGTLTLSIMRNGSGPGTAVSLTSATGAGVVSSGVQVLNLGATSADTIGLQASATGTTITVSGTLRVAITIRATADAF